ncbi:MAG TPA: OsmC family protein [Coriobacteriia bacterium]
MDTVRVRWAGRRQFVGFDEAGHGLVMDAKSQFKGEGTGPRPVELVLYALGGCTAMDVVSVLEKKRLDVRGVEVVVTGTQREDDYPHYYESIGVEYVVTGRGIPDAAVARAIELSEDKYCSVKGTLGPQVKVTTSFRVVEAAGPEPAP